MSSEAGGGLYPDSADEEIRRRLEAAERVCLLVGWLPVHRDSDRGRALHQLWRHWYHAYGREIDNGEGSLGLDEAAVTDLARQQRETGQLEHMRYLRPEDAGIPESERADDA